MVKNIGLVWLKDDFRIKKNLALSEATKKHKEVVAFYLYKKKNLKSKRHKGGGLQSLQKNLK